MSDFGLYGSGFGLIGQGKLLTKCGGFSCPCELLEGDNSDCFDIDCTPSTYYLTWSGVQYCLTYVSGSTWNKTVGDIVVTLNLSSASETASITVVNDGVTVFSGTFEGTSCVHRLTGTMDNTISPSSWGTVTYSNNCTQPEFSCSCTPETGDLNGAFTTNETPGTYIAVIDDHYYCLEYDTENDVWTVTVGSSLIVTLDLYATATTSSLTIVDNGITVYLGYYSGTSGIHRWSGSDMVNTIEGSDWSTGSYYTTCTQTTQPNCSSGCSTLAGTACSCFGNGATPTIYYIVFAGIIFCATRTTGCIWVGTYGDLAATLTIGTTTTLVITDNGSTVFNGSVTGDVCVTGGEIENSLTNDWGMATFYPACTSSTCAGGKLFKVEFIDLDNVTASFVTSTRQLADDYGVFADVFGFFAIDAFSSACRMVLYATGETYKVYRTSDCQLLSESNISAICFIALGSGSSISITIGNDNRTIFQSAGGATLPYATMNSGDSVIYNNTVIMNTATSNTKCVDTEYYYGANTSGPTTIRGSIKITAL